MSVILGSTGITFPDATTQTTAATAGGVTSIVAGTGITTSGTTTVTVNVATTVGAVGTYMFCYQVYPGANLTPGTTIAGSNLNAWNAYNSGPTLIYAQSGTWRTMGYSLPSCCTNKQSTLFLRIA
jgi:hypothetical protein